jgi:hypothetical protein
MVKVAPVTGENSLTEPSCNRRHIKKNFSKEQHKYFWSNKCIYTYIYIDSAVGKYCILFVVVFGVTLTFN